MLFYTNSTKNYMTTKRLKQYKINRKKLNLKQMACKLTSIEQMQHHN